jgi:hypothetical protein
MTVLPSVLLAEYRGAFRIRLVFNDGSEGTVSFRRWLKGPIFEPLKDLDYFRRFFVDGGTVTWPNGADVAPETLYKAVVGVGSSRRRVRKADRSRSKPPRGTSN